MKSLVSLKNIAERCYNLADKEVVVLETQIFNIRLEEQKFNFKTEKRIELEASRRVKKESLEYYKGIKSAYKIMLDSINTEIGFKEIEEGLISLINA